MTQRVPRRRGRVAPFDDWWSAVSGGRFFTWWTLVASGLAAVFLLSPIAGPLSPTETTAAMFTSLLTWVVIVLVVLPVAVVERRLQRPAARGALVVAVLVTVSLLRPFLNDATGGMLFGLVSEAHWAQRIATNALIWFTLLPLVAAAANVYEESRRSSTRLSAALSVFEDLQRRIADYGDENARLLTEEIRRLRRQRDEMLERAVDFDAVRAFADDVRATSHRLDERLQTPIDHRPGYAVSAGERPRPRAGSFLAQLGRPPAALVLVVYFLASAPYTVMVGGWPLLLASASLLIAFGVIADLIARWAEARATPPVAGAVFLIVWTAAGAGMSAGGAALTSIAAMVLLVPLLSIPGLALICAIGVGAMNRAESDRQSLSQLLTATSSLVTSQTARARDPLWRGVDLLHDRVQSTCVIFAARADERQPTPQERDRFRRDTDFAFDEILAGASAAPLGGDDIDGLLATWSEVLDVRAEIDPLAVAALQAPAVAAAVGNIISEGFVNAVKHSSARTARVRVTSAPDGSAVSVAIVSPGTLRPQRVRGLGLSAFDDRARLTQVGRDVVLEVAVPTVTTPAPTRAPSRRWDAPTEPVRLPPRPTR